MKLLLLICIAICIAMAFAAPDPAAGQRNELRLPLPSVDSAEEARADEPKIKEKGIATAVRLKLLLEPKLQGSGINVSAEDGRLMLTGTVQSEAQRALAASVTRRTADGEELIDELRIKPPWALNFAPGHLIIGSVIVTTAVVALLFWLHGQQKRDEQELLRQEEDFIESGGDPRVLPKEVAESIRTERTRSRR